MRKVDKYILYGLLSVTDSSSDENLTNALFNPLPINDIKTDATLVNMIKVAYSDSENERIKIIVVNTKKIFDITSPM